MKSLSSFILTLLCSSTLLACSSGANRSSLHVPNPTPTPPASADSTQPIATTSPEPAILKVELMTAIELVNQSGAGCGMTLWRQQDGLRPPGYLFYNPMAQKPGNEFTLMKINDKFVRFRRIAATGQEFYGQKTSQTFVSQDKSMQLQVDIELGKPGEIESFAVAGTPQVQHQGKTVKIPVRGSAGC